MKCMKCKQVLLININIESIEIWKFLFKTKHYNVDLMECQILTQGVLRDVLTMILQLMTQSCLLLTLILCKINDIQ